MTYTGYHGRKTTVKRIAIVNVDGVEKKYTLKSFMTYKEILKAVYDREKCLKAWVVNVTVDYFEE